MKTLVKLTLMILVCAIAVTASAKEMTFTPVKFDEVDAGMPYKIKEVPATDPKSMAGAKIAIVCAHGFEEVEATYPLAYFLARGAEVDIVTPDWIKGRVMAVQFLKPSIWIPVTKNISEVKGTDYCAVVIPGGAWNPIIMRTDGKILDFVKEAYKANKLIASVCHGPQVLINAGLVKGRDITGVGDIRGDLRNAGANVIEDQPVVVDGHLLTSRDPNDLAEFSVAIETYLKKNVAFCKSQEAGSGAGSHAGPQPRPEQAAPDRGAGYTVVCDQCQGTGKVTGGPGNYPYACPKCKGTGKVPANPGQAPVSTDH